MLSLSEHLTFSCGMVIKRRALFQILSIFHQFAGAFCPCIMCRMYLEFFQIVIGIIPFTFTLTNVLLYCCDRNHNWVLSIFCNLSQRTWLGTRFYHF